MSENTITRRMHLLISVIGLSPVKLSKSLNTDTRNIKRVLSGQSEPGFKLIQALVTKYEVSANWLIQGKGGMFTRRSTSNTPAEQSEAIAALPSLRYTAQLEVLACFDLWLSSALAACFRTGGHIAYHKEKQRVMMANPGMSISLEATMTVNRKTKYTINSGLDVLP